MAQPKFMWENWSTPMIERKDSRPPAPPDPARPIEFTPAAKRRPRILANAERLADIQSRLKNPIEAEMLAQLRARVEAGLKESVLPQAGADLDSRDYSSWQAPLALLFTLTGEKTHLERSKALTLALLRLKSDSRNDLTISHALATLAWTYDLLYEEWTPAERREILEGTRALGTGFFSRTAAPLGYWSYILLQNHAHVACTGFGLAGLAFHDEIDCAREWVQWAHRMYRTISWLLPADGSSCEGPSYGAYSLERRLMYYETAKRLLGEDLYEPAERHAAQWIRHQLLPDPKPWRNALPWGDTLPFYDYHGPVHILFALAARFQDPEIQGLALRLWRLKIGARNLGFYHLLNYDPHVPEGKLDDKPRARHFEDLDLVCSRSDWSENATLVSCMCGPYQGHRAMKEGDGDLGGAHAHPDSASLQLYARGEFLLSDPGYEHIKHTDHHNTLLVNNHGQLGGGIKWFNVNRVLHFGGTAEILAYRDDARSTAFIGDPTKNYVPEVTLERFRRHVCFVRPDYLVVLDELIGQGPSIFMQLWHTPVELTPLENRGWGFTKERAAFSLWPLAVAGESSGAGELSIHSRLQPLPDLSEKDKSQYELRVASPKAKRFVFTTVFAVGDAQKGPPIVAASATETEIRVAPQGGAPFSVRFDLEGKRAPELV